LIDFVAMTNDLMWLCGKLLPCSRRSNVAKAPPYQRRYRMAKVPLWQISGHEAVVRSW